MDKIFEYFSDGVSFSSRKAAAIRQIYMPLCSPREDGIKSSITPLLSGDIKRDKSHYLTKPASREDLRNSVRDFFLNVDGRGLFVFSQAKSSEVTVEVGQLWHKVVWCSTAGGFEITARTFVPVSGEDVELTCFSIRNISGQPLRITATGVVPLFARALANKHDHEHVTSLLHRVEQVPEGVLVEPVMIFNEEGHTVCSAVYFVFGAEGNGKNPEGSFPVFDDFLGDNGNWSCPEAIVRGKVPRRLSSEERNGKEAVGALRFFSVELSDKEGVDYILCVGMAESRDVSTKVFSRFSSMILFEKAFTDNAVFWTAKTAVILFDNGDKAFSAWMRWVTLQPVLRRIFGCSFLPDHDYGKGGKGWRDIWQDLLSLILIEPERVRSSLLNNFCGVRIDGTNATIIGQKPGEFVADRNAITRVWMDHGVWPFLTVLLYIHQTGDYGILFESVAYFSDPQMARSTRKNDAWSPAGGERLKDKRGRVHYGTVLEHILVQHLVPFFNVGEHNMIRLESADWNDGLDMAFKRGESAAFTSFYAGNLLSLADLLEGLIRQNGLGCVHLSREMSFLLDTLFSPVDYNNVAEKKYRIFEGYFKAVQPEVSGETIEVLALDLVKDLRCKGEWLTKKIRSQEKVSVLEGKEKLTWFNGYYDNDGERVEGCHNGHVRMTLTGQVFPVMHGVAEFDDVTEIVKAVRCFLAVEPFGGVRLNTDFGVRHYPSLGRAFAFAFGTKENGSVFSHMAVMYAYALYKRGFAREGFEVLRSLYNASVCPGRAMIYPGVPEYFDISGRGMYPFLTGSASWYVLTLLTMVFGVRGEMGDLVLSPCLVREEFVSSEVSVTCQFAGRRIRVTYVNSGHLDVTEYRVGHLTVNGRPEVFERRSLREISLRRAVIVSDGDFVDIRVFLCS